jgi:hypothetical protein
VAALSETFEEVWIGRLQRLRRRLRRKNGGEFPLVRLNVTRKQRRESYLDLLVRLGDTVRAGQPLYRMHAETSGEFDHARRGCDADAGIAIG